MNKRDVPAEVEVELVARLFNALPQVLCVTTGFVAGSAFIACESGDRWMWAILALAVATSAARIGGVLVFRRLAAPRMTLQQARRWECAYSWPAIAFAVGIAIMTVRVFLAGWVNGEILSIGLTMALTAGSCARTLRYWLCASLSTISLGALIVMLTLSGDPVRMGIAALFGLYLWSVYESSRHIVGQVEALLIAERELDIAARLDPLTGLANRRAFDEALASVSATGAGGGTSTLCARMARSDTSLRRRRSSSPQWPRGRLRNPDLLRRRCWRLGQHATNNQAGPLGGGGSSAPSSSPSRLVS